MTRQNALNALLVMLLATTLLSAPGGAREFRVDPQGAAEAVTPPSYSPRAGRNYPTELLWGDTHLHTTYSPDLVWSGPSPQVTAC